MAAASRPWVWIIVALLLVLAGAIAILLWLVRPTYIPAVVGAPETHHALPFRLSETVSALAHPRSLDDPAALAAAENIAVARLQGAGFSVERQPLSAPGGATVHDVVTRLPDTGRFVILAAHLDTVPGSPGADDDASGVAVVLEVADLVAHSKAANHVVFALFNREESGLAGSRRFVASSLPTLRRRLLGAVVLDAVGFASSVDGSQRAPFPLNLFTRTRGDFLAAITLRGSSALAENFQRARSVAAPALALELLNPPRFLAAGLRDLWRADHAPFWKAQLPALFLTDTANFRNPHYHRPTDVPETLNYDLLAAEADALAEFVRLETAREK